MNVQVSTAQVDHLGSCMKHEHAPHKGSRCKSESVGFMRQPGNFQPRYISIRLGPAGLESQALQNLDLPVLRSFSSRLLVIGYR